MSQKNLSYGGTYDRAVRRPECEVERVRFGLQLAPVEGLPPRQSCLFAVEAARLSARYQFDVIAAPQHYRAGVAAYPHAMTLLARLAGETAAELATGVLPLPLLPAADIAEAARTLCALHGGRFVLGLGLGYRLAEYESFGVRYAGRGELFEEKLRAVMDIWDDYDAGAKPAPGDAGEPRPRVWIGASVPAGIRRAAALADAWLVPPSASPSDLDSGLAIYRRACLRAGRPPAGRLPVRRDLLICGPGEADLDAAWQRVRARRVNYASWGLFGPGQGATVAAPPELTPAAGAGATGTAGDAVEIVGTAAECRAALAALESRAGQPILVILRVAWPGMGTREVLDQIRRVGEELIPAINEEERDGERRA